MGLLKLLLGFAPWLAFLFIAQDTIFRLKVGLLVAFILSIITGLTKLSRGIIFWITTLFFLYAIIAVVIFNNIFTEIYMGIFANGTLAIASWLSLLIKRPFTLEYAREHTPKSRWNDPLFIRTNVIVTSVWALVFTISSFLSWGETARFALPSWGYGIITYGLLIVAVASSTWYPSYVHKRHS